MAWLDTLFKKMVEDGASDLHMSSTIEPMFRTDGDMARIPGYEAIPPDKLMEYLKEIVPESNLKQFNECGDTDFAYELEGVGRYRANFFMDRLGPGAVFRLIPTEILTAKQLGLPKAVMDLCYLSRGLVVVTGPTGSGKSTTLAAMIDHINDVRTDHIITIEDPVEFVHKNKRCLINQREVYRHTDSFKKALRAALREDPDIVLVGEMRDLETVEIAIETAETGHLVFGTLHTTTAASTVDRIIDQFSADRQAQIRTMLSNSIKGVVAQTLCKKIPKGRIAALEIMIGTSAIASNIRDGKTHQLPSIMQTGSKVGMRLLNDSLLELVKNRLVEPLEAYMKSVNKEEILSKLKGAGFEVDTSKLAEGGPPKPAVPAAPPAPPAPSAPVAPASDDPAAKLKAAAAKAKSGDGGGGGDSTDPFEQFRKDRG